MKTAILLGLLSIAAFAQGTFTDSRDGKKYKSVKIGEQVWMAENLAYNEEGSKCYDNKPDNCTKYGKLYNWNMATKACPDGWHLPNNEEWTTLVNFVGGRYQAGKKLKAKSGWNECKGEKQSYDFCGTDDFGFSALPGGSGSSDGSFDNVGYSGFWWSDTKDWRGAYRQNISSKREDANSFEAGEATFFSVRCVQGEDKKKKAAEEYEARKEAEKKAEEEAMKKIADAVEGSFTDPRDSKTYKTVKIDKQTWMAENLNYNASGSKCYDNKPENCTKCGRLYNWATAKTACPKGWHLPSQEELSNFSFSALSCGYGNLGGAFDGFGDRSDFWSATEQSASHAYNRNMYNGPVRGWRGSGNLEKSYLLSVRCIQDGGATPTPTPTPTPAPSPTPAPTPTPTPAPAPAPKPAPASSPAPAPAPASNASNTMYCVIYMGGKLTTCTEMKDTKDNKSKCDAQSKGLKLVRGEAKWTAAKPNINCGK